MTDESFSITLQSKDRFRKRRKRGDAPIIKKLPNITTRNPLAGKMSDRYQYADGDFEFDLFTPFRDQNFKNSVSAGIRARRSEWLPPNQEISS